MISTLVTEDLLEMLALRPYPEALDQRLWGCRPEFRCCGAAAVLLNKDIHIQRLGALQPPANRL